MYEVLLKWGLDTLQVALKEKSKEEISIALEAIKTKNTFVIHRYNYAFTACEELFDLYISIEGSLRKISTSQQSDSESYINWLIHDFHPKRYRRFKKIRSMFQLTNDLLATYSHAAFDLINAETIRSIIIERNYKSRSDINNIYLSMWSHMNLLFSGLTRISSSDLRFWLNDHSYSISSREIAKIEFNLIRLHILKKQRDDFTLLLENTENIEHFWNYNITKINNTY